MVPSWDAIWCGIIAGDHPFLVARKAMRGPIGEHELCLTWLHRDWTTTTDRPPSEQERWGGVARPDPARVDENGRNRARASSRGLTAKHPT